MLGKAVVAWSKHLRHRAQQFKLFCKSLHYAAAGVSVSDIPLWRSKASI
jgi:hypothetical protein